MSSESETFTRFIRWQCRLRKLSMREMNGQPSAGMSAGIHSVNGGDEQARFQFLIVKQEPQQVTAELQHVVRKTPDSSQWQKNGLRILAERFYQDDFDFANLLIASFALDSSIANALLEAGLCQLKFKQDSIDFEFDFDIEALKEDHPHYQATYWHNHLFNPTMPGKVRVLQFTPRL